jgi:transcriptional regulator with XRE-family HTH domain
MIAKLGAWIRQHRQERGWSQADLARAAGISQQQISNIENGLVDTVTWRMIEGLARAFAVTERDLLLAAGLITGPETDPLPPDWVRDLVRYGQLLSPQQRRILITLAQSLAEEHPAYQVGETVGNGSGGQDDV